MSLLMKAFVMCVAFMLVQPVVRGQGTAGDVPRARKVDEFDDYLRGCDHGARLDNFAIELTNHADAVGYVIAYGPRGEGSGTADFRLRVSKDYFVNTRGLDAERIHTVNGGRYKTKDKSFVEFWLVPSGAEPPRPQAYQNDADKFAGKFSEFEAWDSFEWGEGTGPPTGNANLAGFADVLKSQPEARGYVVAYNGEESATGAWRRVAEKQSDALVNEYGIAAGRVRIIFGGYAKELKLEFWALARDAPPPAREAGPERRFAESEHVGRMNDYQLKYEHEQRALFRAFAEVLKADEALTAHVIIRLPDPPEKEEELGPGEPPAVDLPRLVEKWKDELKKDYGIMERRFVVQVVPPQPDVWGDEGIEAWVVPPGAAPPDPYAEPEPEAGEESEESEEKPKEGQPEEL